MISRDRHTERVTALLAEHPAVAILGARQVGKTTLARTILGLHAGPGTVLDLENPDDLARLAEPMIALRDLRGLVVIDEIQRRPNLFPILKVLLDRPDTPARFLILGSASRDLIRQSSETLAGRIIYHQLDGFGVDEVGTGSADTLWVRGGFPRSFLATSDAASMDWRHAFVQTFLERDVPQLGIRIAGPTLHRFWRMLAHYHAQVWNGAELARAFGVSATTVRRYLDVLSGTLVVRQLQPWYENVGKRQVKSPKVFVADTGLLHALLGIGSRDDLDGHPKVGASWEGFVLHEIITRLGARDDECFFWTTHAGAELDLLVVRGRRRLGFEIKRTTTPSTTRSIHAARSALKLDEITIVHAGEETFPIAEWCRAVAFGQLFEHVGPMDPA